MPRGNHVNRRETEIEVQVGIELKGMSFRLHKLDSRYSLQSTNQ